MTNKVNILNPFLNLEVLQPLCELCMFHVFALRNIYTYVTHLTGCISTTKRSEAT